LINLNLKNIYYILAVTTCLLVVTVTNPCKLHADSLTEARLAELKNEKNAIDKYINAYRDKSLSQFSRSLAKKQGIKILIQGLSSEKITQKIFDSKCNLLDYNHIKPEVKTNDNQVEADRRKILEIVSGYDVVNYQTLKSIKRFYSEKPDEFALLTEQLWNEASTETTDSQFQSGLLATLVFFECKIYEIARSRDFFHTITETHFRIAVSLSLDAVKKLFKNILSSNVKENLQKSREIVSFCFNKKVKSDTYSNIDYKNDVKTYTSMDSEWLEEYEEFTNFLVNENPDAYKKWAKLPVFNNLRQIDYSDDIVFNWLCLHKNGNTNWENELTKHFTTSHFDDFKNYNFNNEKDFEIYQKSSTNGPYSQKTCFLMRNFFWNRLVLPQKNIWQSFTKIIKELNPHLQIYLLRPLLIKPNQFQTNLLENKNIQKKIIDVFENALETIPLDLLHEVYDYEEISTADGSSTYINKTIYDDYSDLIESIISSNNFQENDLKKLKLNWSLKSLGQHIISDATTYEEIRKLPAYQNKKFIYAITSNGKPLNRQWISLVDELYVKKKIASRDIKITLSNNEIEYSNTKKMFQALMSTSFFPYILKKDLELKSHFIEIIDTMITGSYSYKPELLNNVIDFIIGNKFSVEDSGDPIYTILQLTLNSPYAIEKKKFWNLYTHIKTKEKHSLLLKHISSSDVSIEYIPLNYLSHVYGNINFPLEIQMCTANYYGFNNTIDQQNIFNFIMSKSKIYKSDNNIKDFKKCYEYLEVIQQFDTNQKIKLIVNPDIDIEFKKSAINSLPGKLDNKQHSSIKQYFTTIENNNVLLKTLLNWVKNSNKERKYADLIADNFLEENIDIEIRALAKEAIEEIIRNENSIFDKEEYKAKIKKLDDKLKKRNHKE